MTEWGLTFNAGRTGQPGRGARKNYGSGTRLGSEKVELRFPLCPCPFDPNLSTVLYARAPSHANPMAVRDAIWNGDSNSHFSRDSVRTRNERTRRCHREPIRSRGAKNHLEMSPGNAILLNASCNRTIGRLAFPGFNQSQETGLTGDTCACIAFFASAMPRSMVACQSVCGIEEA